ncbi:MAG: Hsp20/alpha crystallin family protein [Candidatus Lokiarchaeota archaeon]|nr:Hsp20/alpha crystallin family protein [Candidatus Lokiarchaeota archaeon]
MSKSEDTHLMDKEKEQKRLFRITPKYYSELDRKKNIMNFEIHLPGVQKEKVSLKILPDLMHLEATREMDNNEVIYTLTRYFSYEVEPDSIEANCSNGLLKFSVKIKDPLAEAIDIKLS